MRLDDEEVIDFIIVMLQTSYHLAYCNLSYSHIRLHDLIRIVSELAKSARLEYCDIGGNRARHQMVASMARGGKEP